MAPRQATQCQTMSTLVYQANCLYFLWFTCTLVQPSLQQHFQPVRTSLSRCNALLVSMAEESHGRIRLNPSSLFTRMPQTNQVVKASRAQPCRTPHMQGASLSVPGALIAPARR